MDGWRFEVVQKVIDDGNPYAWIFFIIFIFIASFAILNLFIALVVDALASEQKALLEEGLEEIEEEIEEEFEDAHAQREQMLKMLNAMRAEIAELKQLVSAREG
jgi:voltage-gated sodium channel